MGDNGSDPRMCKFCGSNMATEGIIPGHVSTCGQHDTYICPVCCNCQSLKATPDIVERAKEFKQVYEAFLRPIMNKLKTKRQCDGL